MATETQRISRQVGQTRTDLAADMDASVKDMASQTSGKVSEAASEAVATVRQAPQLAAQQTRGNPIAAGLIAFGAGLLAAAFIPESDVERRASRKLADSDLIDKAREPLMESAQQMGQEIGDSVKETAGEVGQSAKEHARQATRDTKDSIYQR